MRGAVQRVGLVEGVGSGDLGDEAGHRRGEERRANADRELEREKAPQRRPAGEQPKGEAGLGEAAKHVGPQHEQPTVHPVRDHAGHQQEERQGEDVGRKHQADIGG